MEAGIDHGGRAMQQETTRRGRRIDQFFSAPGARADGWRDLLDAAQAWSAGRAERSTFDGVFADIAVIEEFHAYPGARLMTALRDCAATGDAKATLRLVRRITNALLT